MSKEEKVFEMMKAIALAFVSKGIELQEKIIAAGANPAWDCKRKIIGEVTISTPPPTNIND